MSLIERDIAKMADALTDEQRDGLLRSRLMVSGGVRLPWGPEPFGSLNALGLARYGGYLTQLGIDVKHHIRRHGQSRASLDNSKEGEK